MIQLIMRSYKASIINVTMQRGFHVPEQPQVDRGGPNGCKKRKSHQIRAHRARMREPNLPSLIYGDERQIPCSEPATACASHQARSLARIRGHPWARRRRSEFRLELGRKRFYPALVTL
jgi:hypothetical protein